MKRRHDISQNFLRDPRLVHELIGHTNIKRTDVVYDVGAGSGVISSALARRCRQVIAVEVDPQTADILRRNMAKHGNVSIIQADFLEMELPDTPYKIFANIPFHLSSPILKRITTTPYPPSSSYLIVQKQFAYKLLPEHKGFSSQLGMILGVRFDIKIRKRLKRTDFWPHPNVDTVLLEISQRDTPLIPRYHVANYEAFIRTCFTDSQVFSKLAVNQAVQRDGLKPSSLTLPDWVSLFTDTL